ncbi:hypothetical protein HK100_003961 [Physocladia obscura]|uniref:Uncharacterized protein n=1 Tax=Physocladia obscura TaxID=109957 RepID=A0AAD5XCX2_9FUNG|nr:hypothetical protein HK100_003961 [Physocladia obscura]
MAAYETDIVNAVTKNSELHNENTAITAKLTEIMTRSDAITGAKETTEVSTHESNAKIELASDLAIEEGEVSDMIERIDFLTIELKQLAEQNQENERKVIETEKLVFEKSDKIKSLERQLIETKNRVSKLEANLAISEDNETDSVSDLLQANEKISALKNDLKRAVEHSEKLNNELVRLRASKESSKQPDNEVTFTCITKHSEVRIAALEAELQNSYQTLVEMKNSSEEFSKTISQLEKEKNTIRFEMYQLQVEKSSFESAANAMSEQCESLNVQISKLSEELEIKSNATVQLKQQLDYYNSELINETNARELSLEQELKFARERISEFEIEQLHSAEKLKQTTQKLQSAAEMAVAQQDKEAIEACLNNLFQSTTELKDTFTGEGTNYIKKLSSAEKEPELALSKFNTANEDLKNTELLNSYATESCKQFDILIKQLESEKQYLQIQLEHALEQGTIAAKSLALSQNLYQSLQTQLDSLNVGKLRAKSVFDKEREEFITKIQQLSAVTQKVSLLEAEKMKSSELIEKLQAALLVTKETYSQSDEKVKTLQEELSSCKNSLAELEIKYMEEQSSLEDKLLELDNLTELRRKEKDGHATTLANLNKEIESLQRENATVKTLIFEKAELLSENTSLQKSFVDEKSSRFAIEQGKASLEQRIEQITTLAETLEAEVITLRTAADNFAIVDLKYKDQVFELESKIASLHESLQKSENALTSTNDLFANERSNFTAKLETLTKFLTDEKVRFKAMELLTQEQASKLEVLRNDILEINVDRDTANKLIEQKSEEIKKRAYQIENLYLKLKKANDEHVELNAAMQEAKNIIEILNDQVTAFENLVSTKDEEVSSLQCKINVLSQVIREKSNKNFELEDDLEKLRASDSDYSEKLVKIAEKLETLLADYEQIKSQVLQQQKIIESLENEKLANLETVEEKDRKIKGLSKSIAELEIKLEIGDRESATVKLLTKKVGELSDILSKNDFTIKQFEEALILAQKLMDQRDLQISELCEASSAHKLRVDELEGKLSDACDQIKKQLEDIGQSERIFADKEAIFKSSKENLTKQMKEKDARILELESGLIIAKNQFDADIVEIAKLQTEIVRSAELATKSNTRIDNLQQNKIELQKTINNLQIDLSTAKAKIHELKCSLGTESDLLRKLRAEEVQSHIQIAELTTEEFRLKQLLADQNNSINSKELIISQLCNESSNLKATVSKNLSEIKILEDAKVNLVEAAAEISKSVSVLEAELRDTKIKQAEIAATKIAEIIEKDAIIKNLQLTFKELDGKFETLVSEKSALGEGITQRDTIIVKNKTELKFLVDERKTLSEQLDILQEEVFLLKSTVDNLQKSLEEKDLIVSELESRAQENDDRNQSIQDTSINLARENKKLLRMKKAFEGNIRKLEKQLEAARSDILVETNVPLHVEESQTTPKGSKRPATSNNTSAGPFKVARTVERPKQTADLSNGSNASPTTQTQAKYRRRTTMAAKKPEQAAKKKDECPQQ